MLGSLPLRPLQDARPGRSAAAGARALVIAGRRAAAAVDGRGRGGPDLAPRPQNRARELQNLPSNVRHARAILAERASEIAAAHDSVERRGARTAARSRRRAWAGSSRSPRGATEEPRLIVLRYAGGGERRDARPGRQGASPSTPAASRSSRRPEMQEMKMDMSGGAAVLEAVAAIAELALPISIVAVRARDREHAGRVGDQARRHHHAAQRQDGRGQQHRRRGPPDPRRRARPTACASSGAERDRRPRDPDRRGRRRARLDLRRR